MAVKHCMNLQRLFILLSLWLLPITALCAEPPRSCITADGRYNGVLLQGKVKIVSTGGIKVRVVDAFPDLDVRFVGSMASHVGEWNIVPSGEDFAIRFVEHGEDIRIRIVGVFPGVKRKCPSK